MAKIPDVYRERVTPQPSMDVARHESGIFGRALQQVGRNVAQFGVVMQKEQQRLDETRADEAKNRYRQKLLDATVAPPEAGKDNTGGYANLRGGAWVKPDSTGEVPLDKYRRVSTAARDDIARELGLSGNALNNFNAFAVNADLEFQSGLLRHALRESDSYYKQTYDSTLKTEALAAGANWSNPDAVVEAMRRASEATAREAERVGAVDVEAAQQEALAGIHEAVIDGALRDGNSKFAEQHLSNYKETLPPRVALTLHNKVQNAREQQIASEVSNDVMQSIAHRVMPSEYDRARGLVDTTPGKVEFRVAMQKAGGDVEKAWAIHHAGPEVVAKAEVQAMKSERENKKDSTKPAKVWLDFVPKETRDQVLTNSKAYAVGAGVTEPTLLEVKEMARRQVIADNPNATGNQVDAALTRVEQQFNDMRTARNQTQEAALLDVKRRIDMGEIRSRQDLTPQDMSLLGDKVYPALAHIESAQGDQDKIAQASPAAREQFDRLMASPDVLAATDTATIMSLSPELGKKWTDALLQRKQDYNTHPEKFTAARIDADTFEVEIAPFLEGVSKKAVPMRKHQVRQKVEAEIARRRAAGESGVAISKDLPGIIRKFAMSYPVEEPGLLWGTNMKQVPGVEVGDVDQPLPPDEAKRIDALAARRGLTNLTDSDRLRIYRMMKAAEAAQ